MAENSKIEWCDDSVNLWWGCVEVGPGCDNCYARELSKRWGFDVWGTDKNRRTMPNAFHQIAKLQRKAKAIGTKRKVFINSMSDLAELLPVNHPASRMMYEARGRFLTQTVHECPDLIFIWLTKRIGNVPKIVPGEWMRGDWPANVWLVPSIVNQKEADRDIPKLLSIPAKVRGLSMEPLLGPVDLTNLNGLPYYEPQFAKLREFVSEMKASDTPVALRMDCLRGNSIQEFADDFATVGIPFGESRLSMPTMEVETERIDWVIVGGESGPKARPMHPDWVRSLRDQCQAASVPFFFKQWGAFKDGSEKGFPTVTVLNDGTYCPFTREDHERVAREHGNEWERFRPTAMAKVGKQKSGRLLDGREWNEFPEAL